MSGVLAQTGEITMPSVDWVAVAPFTALLVGALGLLVLASLARHTRWIGRVHVWFTVGTAAVAALFTIPLWDRVHSGKVGTAIANAVNIDGFGVFVTLVVCAAVALAALVTDAYLRREDQVGPELFVLMMLSASGGVVMAIANDFIVLFLGLEILSIALYALAGSDARRAESQEAALKYFLLGGMASAIFLYGIALTYGATGSTNFDEVRGFLGSTIILHNGTLTAGLALLTVGMAFKVAAVPFHMWTPDVYQGSPSPATGFMAAAAKAAGFAGMLRVLLAALDTRAGDWRPVVWLLSILTMVVGAVLAAVQTDIKRMMAYSSISHAGFILIGLQAGGSDGVAGSLLYLMTYTFVVLGTFAVITVVGGRGDRSHSLDDYRGLGRRSPALALTFTLLLLAQAGIPATSGFIAKFGVISAAVDQHSYAIAIVAMLASVVTAFFYLRVIVQMYMTDDEPTAAAAPAVPVGIRLALLASVAFTLYAGLAPQTLIDFAHRALLR